jgi:hypothetical protein
MIRSVVVVMLPLSALERNRLPGCVGAKGTTPTETIGSNQGALDVTLPARSNLEGTGECGAGLKSYHRAGFLGIRWLREFRRAPASKRAEGTMSPSRSISSHCDPKTLAAIDLAFEGAWNVLETRDLLARFANGMSDPDELPRQVLASFPLA